MQYIDDDMDEVFKRAAENYPLNTDSADWNEVLRKLSADDPEKTTVAPVNKKNYKGLLLLLLLLPATWIGYEYFNPNNISKSPVADKSVSKNIVDLKTESSPTPSSPTQSNTTTSKNSNIQQPVTPASIQTSSITTHSFIKQDNKNNIYEQRGQLRSTRSAPQTNSIVQDQSPALEDVNKKEATQVSTHNENGNVKPVTENNVTMNVVTTQADNDKKEINTTPAKKQKPTNQHGIYAGIILSPDISSVKLQSIKKTGLSVGLVVGYQFNKKLSLETGIAWNKKHYYSTGEYFNTKNIVLPANAKITQLDGTCKMIEVPVTVRYNFRSSVKTNLSVSAGVSSYIMKSESYDYTIDHTGVQYPRSADYKNSSTNLLAVATAGFGYNRSLGKGATLRLEPYIKIPITGVGIGKLPIMSTGMNIGITKKISNK